ncbi:MAG: YceI family protein [Pseudomonadales bacterium]|nr:YceI family protein [Pseudomonadales bacterium]
MKTMSKYVYSLAILSLFSVASLANAAPERYEMDIKGSHAFIQFKIKHLGYSWLLGRFNQFEGEFELDKDNIEKSKVNVTIDVASIDSNHPDRDKHLRGSDFLEVKKFPKATFVSTKVEKTSDTTAKVTGDFTLKGVTKPLTLDVTYIGGGKDPWGGYRQGFEATTEFKLKDFGITYNLGPASEVVEIYISAEGIRK